MRTFMKHHRRSGPRSRPLFVWILSIFNNLYVWILAFLAINSLIISKKSSTFATLYEKAKRKTLQNAVENKAKYRHHNT